MTKILVYPKKIEDIEYLIKKDITGVILGINDLSVNTPFLVSIEELKEQIKQIKKYHKEVWITLNKNIHNNELDLLKNTLITIDELDIDKIIFYDLSVYNIHKEHNLKKELVISTNHLNASIYSNNFFYNLGIKYSVLTNEITKEEILDIKRNTKMKIIINCYGYYPIFYSRRYLLDNYFKHINKTNTHDYYYIKDKDKLYIINEEKYGTTVYSKKLNYIKETSLLTNVDYITMCFNFDTNYEILDDYINVVNNKSVVVNDENLNFLYTKTIYKVINDEKKS